MISFMKVLILIVHGSRDPKWRAPFERFCEELKTSIGESLIHLCYMEIGTPRLGDVCSDLYASGVRDARLVPLFMASGGHVDTDIPRQAAEVEAELDGFTLEIAGAIGEHPLIKAAMMNALSDLCHNG